MTDLFTIYVVNQSPDTQRVWCFLAPPSELAYVPGVFANSSASMTVAPNAPGENTFEIPNQFTVGAGASNYSVGLNVHITSNVTMNASLADTCNVHYSNVPPHAGPSMGSGGSAAPATAIAVVTNNFNQMQNEMNGWFGNQTFGINTEAGFIGMTWSPRPGHKLTLTPNLTFYVAVGSFGSNTLVNWRQVSNGAAVVQAPQDFAGNACTVTYDVSGQWSTTAGPPGPLV